MKSLLKTKPFLIKTLLLLCLAFTLNLFAETIQISSYDDLKNKLEGTSLSGDVTLQITAEIHGDCSPIDIRMNELGKKVRSLTFTSTVDTAFSNVYFNFHQGDWKSPIETPTAPVTFQSTNFVDINNADCAAIRHYYSGNLTVTGCTFSNKNTPDNIGQAVDYDTYQYQEKSSLTITDCHFININSSSGSVAAYTLVNPDDLKHMTTIAVKGSSIDSPTVFMNCNGPALSISGMTKNPNITVDNCKFYAPGTKDSQNAINIEFNQSDSPANLKTIKITNCTINDFRTDNLTQGAIHLFTDYKSITAGPVISGCTFINNTYDGEKKSNSSIFWWESYDRSKPEFITDDDLKKANPKLDEGGNDLPYANYSYTPTRKKDI